MHHTDRICSLCSQRKGIFETQMYCCSIGCKHLFHSVCHACVHLLVKEALNSVPLDRHQAHDYLPQGV